MGIKSKNKVAPATAVETEMTSILSVNDSDSNSKVRKNVRDGDSYLGSKYWKKFVLFSKNLKKDPVRRQRYACICEIFLDSNGESHFPNKYVVYCA